MRTYRIHLIRHGLTDGNLKGQYIGRTDLPVTPEGVKELQMLKENLDYPFIERLYCSPMLRCRQTAKILFPDNNANIIDNLIEYDFGDFEGKTANELEINPAYLDWTSGRRGDAPNGEDNTEVAKRLALALNEIVRDMMDKGVHESAAIMHGGTIMTLLATCALPRRHLAEWATDNGRGYTILVDPSIYGRTGAVEVIDII